MAFQDDDSPKLPSLCRQTSENFFIPQRIIANQASKINRAGGKDNGTDHSERLHFHFYVTVESFAGTVLNAYKSQLQGLGRLNEPFTHRITWNSIRENTIQVTSFIHFTLSELDFKIIISVSRYFC
jgi:hypothetical protein